MSTTTKNVKRLTAAQKRVLIAKDVIKHLKTEKIIAKHSYCWFPNPIPAFVSVQSELKKMDQPCEVCAVGSMFIAHVLRFNEIESKEDGDMEFDYFAKCTSPLRSYFSDEQLASIEGAYEGDRIGGGGRITDAEYSFQEIEDDKCRLIAICKNIIKHKGIFRPEKE